MKPIVHHTPNALAERTTGSLRARRGVMTLAMIFILSILILAAALAINWTYLVTVQRNTQIRTDLMAVGSVAGLLDQDLLEDLPNDPALVADHVAPWVEMLRTKNNGVGPTPFLLKSDDLEITPGYVADITAEVTAATFTSAKPYNVLKIEAHRNDNPVAQLISGSWKSAPVSVGAISYAILDNQVQGFRLLPNTKIPVVPLAIDAAAWEALITGATGVDTDGSDVRELVVRLTSTTGAGPAANAALVDTRDLAIDLTMVADQTRVLNQIALGLGASDLPASGRLGAAVPAIMPEFDLPATKILTGEALVAQFAAALAAVDASSQSCRAFPIYDTISGGEANIVGFIAARIVSAVDEEGAAGEQRLRLVIEPCYLVHATVWTEAIVAGRNPLIHKVRLLQ